MNLTCVIWDGIQIEQSTPKSDEAFGWSRGQDRKVKRHNATAVWQLQQLQENKKLLGDQFHFQATPVRGPRACR